MLRYLQVLGQWTANYPGDFAEPLVRDLAATFVQNLVKSREIWGQPPRRIGNNLDTVIADGRP